MIIKPIITKPKSWNKEEANVPIFISKHHCVWLVHRVQQNNNRRLWITRRQTSIATLEEIASQISISSNMKFKYSKSLNRLDFHKIGTRKGFKEINHAAQHEDQQSNQPNWIFWDVTSCNEESSMKRYKPFRLQPPPAARSWSQP